MIIDPIAIVVVLAAVVFAAVWLERFRPFKALGSALVSILLAMFLSNVGLLPGVSPAYDVLASTGVSVAIVLILLGVQVRSIVSAGPAMLAAFGIGAVGTALGAVTAALALSAQVGPETWKLAGQYTGTYTGGGVNFAALARALETSSDLFSAAVAADVALTAIWLVACLTLPLLLKGRSAEAATELEAEEPRGLRSPGGAAPAQRDGVAGSGAAAPEQHDAAGRVAPRERADVATAGAAPAGARGEAPARPVRAPAADGEGDLEHPLNTTGEPVSLAEAAALVTLGLGLVWLAGRLAVFVPVPEVLLLTTLVLAVAQVPAVRALSGSALWGNYLLHLFLAANGAQSVIANIFAIGPGVFWFAILTVGIHGLVIFGVGRLVGIDAGTLAVASQANIGGPASAMALAGARGYTRRMLPGIGVGLLGYAVGNYIGFGVARLVRSLLGV